MVAWQLYTVCLILTYTCEDIKIAPFRPGKKIAIGALFAALAVKILRLKWYKVVWFLFALFTGANLANQIKPVFIKAKSYGVSSVKFISS